MEKPFRLNDITEEQISKVIKYFDTYKNGHGDTSGERESQIRIRYGILHSRGELTVDLAKQEAEKRDKRDHESYRWRKEQELNQHLRDYRHQNFGEDGKYELARLYEWEDGRQINIGIMTTENNEIKRSHMVDIEEKQNPDYFQEIVKRFNLVID